ncbi:NADH-quinone oxidoreductase subunit D [Striga asiatica]|uniref:NADH-quinone oxidoreductase subunit D n=1 Tax=Striga asiatica TaxID=4170 RepID=A0A5A7Q8Q6_STRAF|nr:NADH-quinone oxidoreductase subunit D [Striga asiatica]
MSNCCSLALPQLMNLNLSDRCVSRHTYVPSAVLRRHHRRRLLKYSPNHAQTPIPTPAIFKLSDEGLQITLRTPNHSLQQVETRLNKFLDYGRETLDDLKTILTVNGDNGGVVISCRRSTVEFLIALFLTSLVAAVALRGLFKARKSSGEVLIYKRDRSLGGREVVVGKSEMSWPTSKSTPLSSNDVYSNYWKRKNRTKTLAKRRKEELPQWWPRTVNWGPQETTDKEDYQRIVNQLIREALILEALIESISNDATSIQINGEDIREFIAGLADNVGLESTHAARMALEVQNKHAQALAELFKVCLIHRVFPPEENSPEMEMVARGLDKSLSLEQREHILKSFITICGEDIGQSVMEALGLAKGGKQI